MERFELHRIKDFKTNMVRYIEDQMAHQQQVDSEIIKNIFFIYISFLYIFQIITYWESFVPSAREIV